MIVVVIVVVIVVIVVVVVVVTIVFTPRVVPTLTILVYYEWLISTSERRKTSGIKIWHEQ